MSTSAAQSGRRAAAEAAHIAEFGHLGGISIKIEGLKELDDVLRILSTDTAWRIGRKALRRAAWAIQGHAQLLVHSISGALAGSIIVKVGRKANHYASMAIQAGRWGAKDDPFYAGMVEYGHKKVSQSTRMLMGVKKRYEAELSRMSRREGRVFIRNKLASMPWPEEVEFGSRRVPAHPYLRPAFDYEKNQALAIIMASIREDLERRHSSSSLGGEAA